MLVALSMLPANVAAQTVKPAVTLPGPKWSVKVAPGRCTLSRSTSGDISAGISLDSYAGSDSYRFSMAAPGMPRRAAGSYFPVSIVFRGADRRFDRQAGGIALSKQMTANSVSGLSDDFLAAFAEASSVLIESKAGSSESFALPSARAAAKALSTCLADQLIEWGADPAQFLSGGKTPVALTDRDHWLSNAQMVSLPITGDRLDARFLTSVSTDGTIETCKRVDTMATNAVERDAVERSACAIMLSKRLFTPAHGPDGKPVRSMATFEINMEKRPGRGG